MFKFKVHLFYNVNCSFLKMYFVLEFRNKCRHFSFTWDCRCLYYHRVLLVWYLTQEMHALTLCTKLLKYPVFSLHESPKALCANSLTLITHLGDVQAKKRASQTKSQIFAKKPQPPKLVNIYFQLGNLLLIHIVTFPAAIMSQAKRTKRSQWANMNSGELGHLLFTCWFLQQLRNISLLPGSIPVSML